MRWAFGTRRQLLWAFALVALRMVIFGVAYFLVLPALVPRTLPYAKIVNDALLAALALAFVVVFLRGVARASWRDLGFSRERLAKNLLLGVATFAAGLIFIVARHFLEDLSLAESWHT